MQLLCIKPQSDRACDPAATSLQLTKLHSQRGWRYYTRLYKGLNKVASRSPISHQSKSVATSLLRMYTRLATTVFDHSLVANVF